MKKNTVAKGFSVQQPNFTTSIRRQIGNVLKIRCDRGRLRGDRRSANTGGQGLTHQAAEGLFDRAAKRQRPTLVVGDMPRDFDCGIEQGKRLPTN